MKKNCSHSVTSSNKEELAGFPAACAFTQASAFQWEIPSSYLGLASLEQGVSLTLLGIMLPLELVMSAFLHVSFYDYSDQKTDML